MSMMTREFHDTYLLPECIGRHPAWCKRLENAFLRGMGKGRTIENAVKWLDKIHKLSTDTKNGITNNSDKGQSYERFCVYSSL